MQLTYCVAIMCGILVGERKKLTAKFCTGQDPLSLGNTFCMFQVPCRKNGLGHDCNMTIREMVSHHPPTCPIHALTVLHCPQIVLYRIMRPSWLELCTKFWYILATDALGAIVCFSAHSPLASYYPSLRIQARACVSWFPLRSQSGSRSISIFGCGWLRSSYIPASTEMIGLGRVTQRQAARYSSLDYAFLFMPRYSQLSPGRHGYLCSSSMKDKPISVSRHAEGGHTTNSTLRSSQLRLTSKI